MANEVGNGMMENTKKYYVKEDTDYASKGVAGSALGLGIAGTALGLLNNPNGILNGILGGNNQQSGCTVTCDERLADMKEYHNEMFQNYKYTRDSYDALLAKHNADAFAIYQGYTNAFSALQKEVDELKTKNAVLEATRPLQDQLIYNAIALEAERRQAADCQIIGYTNCTFYPVNIADVTVGTTSTAKQLFNPLGCLNNFGSCCR